MVSDSALPVLSSHATDHMTIDLDSARRYRSSASSAVMCLSNLPEYVVADRATDTSDIGI